MRTQVAIVGAGPAGLLLGKALSNSGISSIIVEARDRDYVESRMRAGLLEPSTVDFMTDLGVGERLHEEGVFHESTKFRFDRATHELDIYGLTGKRTTRYPQQEVVKDLIAARLEDGDTIVFDAQDVALAGLTSESPSISFRAPDEADPDRLVPHTIEAHFIAGADGFHGPTRRAMSTAVRSYDFEYSFGWLGILASAPPSDHTGVYAYSPRGFALISARGPQLSRHYVQVDVSDSLDEWPDERIWDELEARVATDEPWQLNRGEILQKAVAPLRYFAAEPMRQGRAFLLGDSAHVVPPTGAKGLNLAAADAKSLGEAFARYYSHADEDLLSGYSRVALQRAWQRIDFSIEMTELLHVMPDADPVRRDRLASARLRRLVGSRAAQQSLLEGYVGLFG